MTTATNRRGIRERFARATAFGLLALAAALCSAPEARAQWVTDSAGNTTTTNKVGIGTTTPSQMFHVHSGGTWAGTRVTTAATGVTINDGVHFGYDNDYGAYVWNREASPVILSTSNTERMRIDANGNLGLGTASPGSRLDISGKLRMFDFAPPGAGTSTNAGYLFGSAIPSGLTTEVGGELVNFGINTPQFGTFNPARSGGLMRVDTRATERRFAFYAYPAGSPSSGINRFSVHLDTGDVFMAANGGNVGIGTAVPIHKLDVSGNMAIGSGYTWSNTVPVNGLIVEGGVGIGTSSPSAQYKLDVAGDVRVSGNISAKYQDVAEWVPSTQKLAAGTVVALDTERANHVVASATAYDTRVAGVISAQPGIALGERGEGKVLVATTGRVKIKVNAAHGPIRIGDLLVTSDVAGVAMKSEPIAVGGRQIHAPGTIIGKALESLERGTGEILVLLSLQ
jgi:hypothetical protein